MSFPWLNKDNQAFKPLLGRSPIFFKTKSIDKLCTSHRTIQTLEKGQLTRRRSPASARCRWGAESPAEVKTLPRTHRKCYTWKITLEWIAVTGGKKSAKSNEMFEATHCHPEIRLESGTICRAKGPFAIVATQISTTRSGLKLVHEYHSVDI